MLDAPSVTRPSRRRLALLLVAAAMLFGVLEASQGLFFYGDIPPAKFWPEALARTLPSWFALVVLAPLVVLLARRVRLDRNRAAYVIPLYAVAGAVFVSLHLGASAAFATWRHHFDHSFEYYLRYFLMRHAVMDYLLFWGLVIFAHFVRHQEERRARERAEAELRAGLAEARLMALRAQLHPHFLFNTLNAVHALALTGDREQLITTIRALSDLLRIVLDDTPGDQGTLESELRFLERYLEIQQVRFGERLRVVFDVPDELLPARIPRLVLQPLIENALEHGLGAKAGPGLVAIRARRDGDMLELRIEDSGPGFAPVETGGAGHGLGLSNTRMRLEHGYGPAAALTCENLPEGGARVTVRLPWRTVDTAAVDLVAAEPVPAVLEGQRPIHPPREARA